jgi:hypothetical protein
MGKSVSGMGNNRRKTERRKNMKKCLLGLLLVVALVAVSCSQDKVVQDDLISISFTKLEAKAISSDYNVTSAGTWGNATVQIGGVNDYYWTYKATKADTGFTTGQIEDFEIWNEGAGLSGSKQFSKGKWTFMLKAYASESDRTAGTKAIFEGEATTGELTVASTVMVPVNYTYVTGTGKASFTITPEIEQAKSAEGTALTQYKVTKVEMLIDGKSVELAENEAKTAWIGTQAEITTGVQPVGIKVYVDNEEEPSYSKEDYGTAIIMYGMTTDITGSAKITLSADLTIGITAGATLPTEQPTEEGCLYKAPANTVAGNTLTFGKIPKTVETYGGTDISWKVLEVKDGKALVISEKVLMGKYYSTSSNAWEGSDLKTYLNGDFKNEYGISNVSFAAAVSSETGYGAGEIFLLSTAETQNTTYFADNASRVAKDLSDNATQWWTRTADGSYLVKVISVKGNPNSKRINEDYFGVRPAFWINLE